MTPVENFGNPVHRDINVHNFAHNLPPKSNVAS
jgi:hypothetical protein